MFLEAPPHGWSSNSISSLDMQKWSPLANQCLWASVPSRLCLDVPTSGSLHLCRLRVSASLFIFIFGCSYLCLPSPGSTHFCLSQSLALPLSESVSHSLCLSASLCISPPLGFRVPSALTPSLGPHASVAPCPWVSCLSRSVSLLVRAVFLSFSCVFFYFF